MTLLEFLEQTPEGDEITVWDNTFDLETYFYNNTASTDPWDIAMMDLASKLNIISIRDYGVIVDLYELIENNIDRLQKADLFIVTDVDSIMEDMDSILAGNVSEDWFVKFVNCLI